jgi:hypothetical protein
MMGRKSASTTSHKTSTSASSISACAAGVSSEPLTTVTPSSSPSARHGWRVR